MPAAAVMSVLTYLWLQVLFLGLFRYVRTINRVSHGDRPFEVSEEPTIIEIRKFAFYLKTSVGHVTD